MNLENVVFIYNGILLSHKNESLSFAGIGWSWRTSSEVSQTQKARNHIFPYMWR
jgi:hypothetical protein